jgi:3-oxoacyl-[acyl-carrier-protein] synthase II
VPGILWDMESTAITGIGVLSSIAQGYDEFEEAIIEGKRAAGKLTLFDPAVAEHPHHNVPNAPAVAEIDFDLEDHIGTVKSYIDRTSALGMSACAMAQELAGWELSDEEKKRAGMAFGTAWGCADSIELCADKFINAGPKRVPSLVFTHSYINAPNSIIAIEYGLRGFNVCFAGGHASGMQAIVYGADQIRLGRAGHLLAGGADALTRFALRGYQTASRLASKSEPFGKNSNGFLLSEGAGVLSLEPASTAGERAYAILAGAGLSRADQGGIQNAMSQAMYEAEIEPNDVSLVVAAGSGDPTTDVPEAGALEATFSEADAIPAVFSLKALTGESMGASGPLAIAAAIALLDHGEVPISTGPDSILNLNGSSDISGEIALVNSVSIDGDACSVVVKLP